MGVGCIIKQDHIKHIRHWNFVSERILKLEIQVNNDITNLVVIYGPNEDETAHKKDEFWEKLTDEIENLKGRIIIIGDINGRVGKRTLCIENSVGPYGEDIRNKNGTRLINFCIDNNFIIANTFFAHKDIHKYTREVISRNEKSIIDYALINRENRRDIIDVKVKREAEIGSDHYLLVTKLKLKNDIHPYTQRTQYKNRKETIRSYRLKEPEIAEMYEKQTEIEIGKTKDKWNKWNVSELWQSFKNIILNAAKEKCGTLLLGNGKKQTRWWNEEIKTQIKIKKLKWKKYLRNRTQENYDDYKQERIKTKDLVIKNKRQTWEEFGTKIEEDSKGNIKLFYKALKNLRSHKQHKFMQLKGRDNKIITEETKIMERWKTYFEELLNAEKQDVTQEKSVKHTNHQHQYEEKGGTKQDQQGTREEDTISSEEVRRIIKTLKRGKSAGHDKITPEMLKKLGTNGIEMLTAIVNKAWNKGEVPNDWRTGIIIPLHKKGDTTNCNNYRGIILLSVTSKIYEKILDNKLRKTVEKDIHECQSGFRKGRSIQDHIFSIKQLIEKTRIQNSELILTFLDLEKAFDRVTQKEVWDSLERRGVSTKLIEAIKNVYSNNRNYVRKDNSESNMFTIKDGLRQGGVLSPTLFIIIMDDVIKSTQQQIKKVYVGHHRLRPVTISECAFADDLVVCAANENTMQENLKVWENELSKRNMKININKTKVMMIGKEHKQLQITLRNEKLEQVDKFKYLGVTLQREGNMDEEINERISQATRLYHTLKETFISKKEISIKTKMTVYKTIFRPILTFGSESWILNNTMKSRIQATNMKYLRRVLGKTRRDRIRNDVIRNELEVKPIIQKIEEQQLKWLGHLTRMNNNRPTKQVWEAKPQKAKKRGRPKKTWNDEIANILKSRGTSWNTAINVAKNKKEWAKFVQT